MAGFGVEGACGLKHALIWEKKGKGGLRAPFLGLSSTSAGVPWTPAPSSSHAWGALDEVVAPVLQ